LLEHRGYGAGCLHGTVLSRNMMSQAEAAALWNDYPDRTKEVADELKRLTAEFNDQCAVLNRRFLSNLLGPALVAA